MVQERKSKGNSNAVRGNNGKPVKAAMDEPPRYVAATFASIPDSVNSPPFKSALYGDWEVWQITTRKTSKSLDDHCVVSITHLPPEIDAMLDYYKTNASNLGQITQPGKLPMLHCALVYGLAEIYNHESLAALRHAEQSMKAILPTGSPQEEAIRVYIKSPILLTLPRTNDRQNIPVHPDFYKLLNITLAAFPTCAQDLAVICIYAYLETQEDTPSNYREHFRREVAKFFFQARMKARAITAMVEEMEAQRDDTSHPLADVEYGTEVLDVIPWDRSKMRQAMGGEPS